jgi:hypothetical protein
MVTGMCMSRLGRLRALGSLFAPAFVVLCSSLFSYCQNSAAAFTDAQPIPLANACSNAFSGHFHRGAKMDLLATCTPPNIPEQGPSTAALMNQGNGMFPAQEDTSIDGVASPVLAVDLNGDGLTDLVINQPFSSTIGVQLSNGDGTFGAPVYYTPTPADPNAELTAVASGDFNGDGKNDVAIITTDFSISSKVNSTNTLTIFLNTGSGGLRQAETYALDSTPVNQNAPLLAAGELDGDHLIDLAVVYQSPVGETMPFFASGGGAFRRGAIYLAGAYPSAAAIGKLTTSGYGDIAIATKSGVAILLGSASGTFTRGGTLEYPYPVPQFGAGAHLFLADLDQDGKEDLAITTDHFADVYWGEGEGKFTGAESFTVPLYPLAFFTADLAGNGRKDLVLAGQDGSVVALSNLGHRSFRAAMTTHSGQATGIVAGDFNADGRADVAVVNTPPCKAPCSGSVTVFPGTGQTWFDPGKRYGIGMHGAAIAAGDLNGDGIPDLVVTNTTAGDHADVSVLLGVKGGGFAAARNYMLGSLSNDIVLADMNRDGKLDLVEDGGIALGKGDGTFGPLHPFPEGLGFGQPYPTTFSMHLAVGDLNGDGIPDVVASYVPPGMSAFASQVWVLLGDGKGNFKANQLEDVNLLVQQVVGIAIGVLQPGGHPNIVLGNNVVNPGGGTFMNAVIFSGDGKGNFQESAAPVAQIDSGSGGHVVLADFNHDGILDIGIGSADQFALALGTGGGRFNSQNDPTFLIDLGDGVNPAAGMAVADFNGDGRPDVVLTNSQGISRLYNRLLPYVSPGALTFTSSGTKSVTVQNTMTSAQPISATLPDGSASAFRISANTCQGWLGSGAKCSVSVEYASQGVPASDTLYIRANGVIAASVGLNGN